VGGGDARLADAFFATTGAAALLDSAGAVVRVNDAFAALAGRAAADIVGSRLGALLDADLASALERRAAAAATSGTPSVELGAVPPADGPHRAGRWLLTSVTPLAPGDGPPYFVGVLLVDAAAPAGWFAHPDPHPELRRMSARATEVLGASLDPLVTLDDLCDLLVPALADHVFVDLREEGGRLRRAAIRHAPGIDVDHALERPVGGLSAYRPGHPVRIAVEQGRRTVITDMQATPDAVPRGADTQFVFEMGVTSVMVLPMLVAGRPMGTAALLASTSGRHYTAADAALAEEVVSRAAVALANAMSYEQQRAAAVSLQRSLMPQTLPELEEVEVAWRYVPGTAGTQVGGDWAEAFALPGGRVAAVVGDVMGRGLRAAAVMGQLRTAVRTLAMTDPTPRELMTRLDEVVRSLPSGQIVTCAYAVYDPGRATACLANAGHLPPVLLRPGAGGGTADLLHEGLSVPLGAGGLGSGTEFVQTEVEVPAGTVLALYTDGLVERPYTDLDNAIDRLAELLREGPSDLGEAAELVLADHQADPAGFDDDVALLLMRMTAVQEGNVVDVKLPSEPESAALARATVLDTLHAWALDGPGPGRTSTSDVAALLVSEVVTNAVRYSSGPIELLLRRSDSALWFEIGDEDSRLPRLRHARSDDEGGRGLALVHALASGWGTREVPTGKVVWFRLDL